MADASNEERRVMLRVAQSVTNSSREVEILADHDSMIHQMEPSCMVIATLGRIMLVTHQDDVSLEKNPPTGGFKYIKHPNSLRASLVQISNDAFEAFKTSHINMNDIKHLTFDIPEVMQNVVDALEMGTDIDIEVAVGDALEELADTVKKCKTLADNTRAKYDYVIEGVNEVLLAATSTKATLEEKDKELMERQRVLEEMKNTNELAYKEAEENKRRSEQEIEKAKKEYMKAKDKMPGNAALVGLAAADTVQSIAMMPIKLISSIPKVGKWLFKKGGDGNETEKDSLVKSAIDKAKGEIDEARDELKRYEQQKETEEKDALDKHRKMMEDMAELRNIDFSKTDIDSVKKSLEKGMKALTSMQAIWVNLAVFFANIVSMVENRFGKDITTFSKKTKNYLKHETDFQRALMFQCLTKATQSSIVLHSLSGTYVDISQTFIMPALGKLPQLIYPEEGTCIQELAEILDKECDDSMKKINAKAMAKRIEMRLRLQTAVNSAGPSRSLKQ